MDITNLLTNLLSKTTSNKAPVKVLTPGQAMMQGLLQQTGHVPMDEKTPIGGSSVQLPPTTSDIQPAPPIAQPQVNAPTPGFLGQGGTASNILGGVANAEGGGASAGASGAAGGLSGALGGMSVDTSPPKMMPPVQDEPQNTLAQSLANGSALRKLATGGVVDPGDTVEVGDGGDGSGAELLHVNDNGQAIVQPLNPQVAMPPTNPVDKQIDQLLAISEAAKSGRKYVDPSVPQPPAVAGLAAALPPRVTRGVDAQREITNANTPAIISNPAITKPQTADSGVTVAQPTDLPPPDPSAKPGLPLPPMINGEPMGTTANGAFTVGTNDAPVPEQDPEKYFQQKYIDAMSPRKYNPILDGLFGALQGVANERLGTNKPIMTLDQLRQQREAAKYEPILNAIGQQKAVQSQRALAAAKQAQVEAETQNIPIKSAIDKMYREGQIDALTNRMLLQQETLKEKKRVDFLRTHRAFDPSTASEADKNALGEFGETPESMGKYDRTTEKSRIIGGNLYQWDANTNSWKDSGVNDPTKAAVDFTVTDPDGTKETFKTTSEKAAELKSGLEKQGYQIQAQERRQANQQQFQQGQQERSQSFSAGQQQKHSATQQAGILASMQASGEAKHLPQAQIDAAKARYLSDQAKLAAGQQP